jgi:two-component system cell cycle sensor histidine kinase/response regulator CckA
MAKRESPDNILVNKEAQGAPRIQEVSYRLLFEKNPQPMWVYDIDSLVFLAVNEAAVKHYGYSSAEFLRMTIRDIRPAQDIPALLENVSREVARVERRHRKKDGGLIDVEVTTNNLDWAGRLARLVLATDITERKRVEERICESEEAYRRLVEQSPDAMLVHRHGAIIFANGSCLTLFGASSAEGILGKQYLELVHPVDREAVQQRIQQFSDDLESVRRNETKFLRLDGSEICAEVMVRSVIYRGDAAIQVVFRDISQRKQMEDKLRQSEANLEAAQAIAHVGNWSWDIINDVLSWSDEMFRIYGVSPEQFDSTIASVARLIHADDLWLHERCVISMLAGRQLDAFEYRVVRPDGSERVVQVLGGGVEHDAAGLPVRISGVVLDITERRKAEERFYKAFHANPEPITIATISEGRYIDVNEGFLRITGYQREEVVGHTSLELNFWEQPEHRARFLEMLNKHGSIRDFEIIFRTKSGKLRTALDSAEALEIAGQKCVLAIFNDITERKALEKQLRQAQKMEAVGRLSGGIAHDFNNLLGVIIGYSEILGEQLEGNSTLRKNATEITKAAQRAASLTRQLLAFSRQQPLERRVISLNAIVTDMQKMLHRLIGEDIELKTVLASDLGDIKADQTQIEQVIMNLVVNARDAMPNGGKVTFETENVEVDDAYARQHGYISSGSFVMLAVTDTGVGMEAETLSHIFEPFFTTKERGKGTGLGLATVYGVIKQSDGFIWVYSEHGHGTTFKMLLPRVQEPVQSGMGSTAPLLRAGSETVLLVEDETSLRELTRNLLSMLGYIVLEAANGVEALNVAREYRGKIDLLLTDVVMPGMNGAALADELTSLYPEIKVLCMSGYTEFASGHDQVSRQGRLLLPKPFTQQDLARKVRKALEANPVAI